MKIYAITKGDYENYHICALTTNYNKAKQFKKMFTDEFHEAKIEGFNDEVLCFHCDKNGENPELCDYRRKKGVLVDSKGYTKGVYLYAKDKIEARIKAKEMIGRLK